MSPKDPRRWTPEKIQAILPSYIKIIADSFYDCATKCDFIDSEFGPFKKAPSDLIRGRIGHPSRGKVGKKKTIDEYEQLMPDFVTLHKENKPVKGVCLATDSLFGVWPCNLYNCVTKSYYHPKRMVMMRHNLDAEQIEILKNCADDEKYCEICKNNHKRTSEFFLFSKKGHITVCRQKQNLLSKINGQKPENRLKQAKYREDNKGFIKPSIFYYHKNKPYYAKKAKEYQQYKQATDPQFRLIRALRKRTWDVINTDFKCAKTMDLIGCTKEELFAHLEKLFQVGMFWENYGEWQIDHIRPLCSFDLSTLEEQKKALNWKNLQPLWAIDNLKKGGKWDPD